MVPYLLSLYKCALYKHLDDFKIYISIFSTYFGLFQALRFSFTTSFLCLLSRVTCNHSLILLLYQLLKSIIHIDCLTFVSKLFASKGTNIPLYISLQVRPLQSLLLLTRMTTNQYKVVDIQSSRLVSKLFLQRHQWNKGVYRPRVPSNKYRK